MAGPEKVTVRHPRPGRLGREEQLRDLCEGRPRHRLQERQDPPRHAGVRGRDGGQGHLRHRGRHLHQDHDQEAGDGRQGGHHHHHGEEGRHQPSHLHHGKHCQVQHAQTQPLQCREDNRQRQG